MYPGALVALSPKENDMGNRSHFPLAIADDPAGIVLWGEFVTNGTGAVAASTVKGALASVTRSAVGTFSLVFREKFYKLLDRHVAVTTADGRRGIITAIDPAAKTATVELRGNGGATVWRTGVTVTTHVAVMPVKGVVVAVHATTATSAGPKQQLSTGTAAAGQVTVTYSAGVATLTFNTTDAVTACAVVMVDQVEDATADTVRIGVLVSNSKLRKPPRT